MFSPRSWPLRIQRHGSDGFRHFCWRLFSLCQQRNIMVFSFGSFLFAPGYARLRNPFRHLKGYGLSEHTWWSVIIPGVLRCWLESKHIQPLLSPDVKKKPHHGPPPPPGTSPVLLVIECFAAQARSNTIPTPNHVTLEERNRLMIIVKDASKSPTSTSGCCRIP